MSARSSHFAAHAFRQHGYQVPLPARRTPLSELPREQLVIDHDAVLTAWDGRKGWILCHALAALRLELARRGA